MCLQSQATSPPFSLLSRRHGTGSLVNGRYKYEGCWADDVQEGVGALVTADGDRYVGATGRELGECTALCV